MSKQISAVEWLVEQLNIWQTIADEDTNATLDTVRKLIEKALEMEKEQIMDAFEAAEKDCGRDFLHGDLYYNETFKS